MGRHDLTLRGLAAQMLHAVSNIDSRLLRSFRCLLTRPGLLTVAYARGQRMPYIGPIQIFLMANVLFFAVQSMTGINVFSSTLDSHLHQQDWSALAQSLVAHRMVKLGTTLELYAPVFDRAVVLHAKSLIFLMVLPLAGVLPFVFRGARRSFVTHAVFSIHLYAFLLLLFCVAMAIAAADRFFGGAGLESAWMDNVLTGFNLGVCALYLYLAARTVYGVTGAVRAVQVLILSAFVAVIVVGYRFALFLITLYA